MKKIDYASLFFLRKDGRYQGYWHELVNGKPVGVRHTINDRDPKRLYERIRELESPKEVLFSAVAEQWWVDHVEKLSRGTQATYKANYQKIVKELGDLPVGNISATDINRLLLDEQSWQKSYKHCAMTRSIINQILNYAILHKYISVNPTMFVSVPRGMKRGHIESPDESVIEIVQRNLNQPFGNFVAVLLYTGMRTEEAAALTWGDIGENEITIHSAVDYHGTPVIKEAKTEAGVRTVPIFPQLRPFLERKKTASDEDYVFSNKGRLLTRSQVSSRWLNWCKASGLAVQKTYMNRRRGTRLDCVRTEWRPLIKPHQLRHHFATICFETGIDPLTTKTLMGHKDITTTQNIYTSLRKKYKEDQLRKLQLALSASSENEIGKH